MSVFKHVRLSSEFCWRYSEERRIVNVKTVRWSFIFTPTRSHGFAHSLNQKAYRILLIRLLIRCRLLFFPDRYPKLFFRIRIFTVIFFSHSVQIRSVVHFIDRAWQPNPINILKCFLCFTGFPFVLKYGILTLRNH